MLISSTGTTTPLVYIGPRHVALSSTSSSASDRDVAPYRLDSGPDSAMHTHKYHRQRRMFLPLTRLSISQISRDPLPSCAILVRHLDVPVSLPEVIRRSLNGPYCQVQLLIRSLERSRSV
jgi:hypothetical protein